MATSSALVEPKDLDAEERRFRCRSLKHWWDFYSPGDWDPGLGLMRQARYVVHLRCEKCTTCRHDGYDSNGQLMARKYDYPDEYKMTEEDRPSTEQLRMWIVKRNRAFRRKVA